VKVNRQCEEERCVNALSRSLQLEHKTSNGNAHNKANIRIQAESIRNHRA